MKKSMQIKEKQIETEKKLEEVKKIKKKHV